jgi:hypothetical protein
MSRLNLCLTVTGLMLSTFARIPARCQVFYSSSLIDLLTISSILRICGYTIVHINHFIDYWVITLDKSNILTLVYDTAGIRGNKVQMGSVAAGPAGGN